MPLFQRDDWTLFRSLNTLGQRAGVNRQAIPRLVAKELVDNALDAGHRCQFGVNPAGWLWVQDTGEGLPGTDEEIAALFSVARPLSSSKLLRLPTRGALGNGLRVVVGAVLASGGKLVVKTAGRVLHLCPRDGDGQTTVERVEPWNGTGTRVEVLLGAQLPIKPSALSWAMQAQALARGETYKGKTSPWWYDSDSFYELTQAGRGITARELVATFAGCAEPKAGKIAQGYAGRSCDSLTRQDAEALLFDMRHASKRVKPQRLGFVGTGYQPSAGYARVVGTYEQRPARTNTAATIPCVVEAWARPDKERSIRVSINRSPITAEIGLTRMNDKSCYGIMGCGLSSEVDNTAFPVKASARKEFSIAVSVITPHMPITTDGKAPDLSVIKDQIGSAVERAIRQARRKHATTGPDDTQRGIIVANLDAAIQKASGNGQYRYSLRQLFYAVRPHVIEALQIEPNYNYFCSVITDCEHDRGGDLPGMYRDDRGTLYHPHTGETIPLGTRSVEEYRRPDWTFNKILYAEKEGFFPILIDAHWPERHDCALLTSKGYGSRAARDVLDLLGDTDEPLTFYCIHDADGPGTRIYQALQHGTAARPGRRVEIVNLGLEPAEALDMGLPAESVNRKGDKRIPVADYVEAEWREWLQENRVELNAMDTPAFLEWLDRKMLEKAKLIPPANVLSTRLDQEVRGLTRRRITDEILRAAKIEQQIETAMKKLRPAVTRAARGLLSAVRNELQEEPAQQWAAPVVKIAKSLVEPTEGGIDTM